MMLQDFRFAVRGLARSPGFTVAVVLTLALGSGANTAIFSIFNQALLRPLPVPAPEQLVNLSSPGPKTGRTSTSGTARLSDVFSYPLFRDIERVQDAFTGIAAHRDFPANVSSRGDASSELGQLVSGDYFAVLGLRPAAGRLLTPDDDQAPGAHHVVVLSHYHWLTRFNADPAILDDSLVVNGQAMTIVGVTPPEFVGTTLENRPRIFVPLSMASLMIPGWQGFENRRDHWLSLFARLKPGVTREAAEAAMSGPFAGILKEVELPAQLSSLQAQDRERFVQRQLLLESGAQGQRPERAELTPIFILLFCVAGVVLLIACANVASLLLARAAFRAGDLAVRQSIGASRRQLIQPMLVESCLLAIMGAAGGFFVATWALEIAMSILPQMVGYLRFELDWPLFLFTVASSGAIALSIGLYPALQGTRGDLASTIKGATTPSGTRSAARFRTSLATLQIALSMALVVVAGLFTKSLLNVAHVELGIETENLTTFRLSPELSGYTPDRARVLVERIQEELRGLPGVQSVSASTIPLLAGVGAGSNVTVDAFGNRSASERGVSRAIIGPEYFRTVGIPLLAGREFAVSDEFGAPKVAIVNEAFARTLTSGQNPIGARMAEGAGNRLQLDIEIVGVVRDARYSQLKDPPPPQYFFPYRQAERFGSLNFYLRSTQPADEFVSMIPAAVSRVDRTLPVENLQTMADQLTATQALDRFVTMLSAAFAGLATLLAAIGLYGVLSFTVAQRRREIGLRMALGADTGDIGWLLLVRVGRMIGIGSVIGICAALALSQLSRALLFGIDGQQSLIFMAAAICTAVVAFGAGAIPAWRATRVDPIVALRTE